MNLNQLSLVYQEEKAQKAADAARLKMEQDRIRQSNTHAYTRRNKEIERLRTRKLADTGTAESSHLDTGRQKSLKPYP